MYERKTQTEEKDYQKGKRAGYHAEPCPNDASTAYRAGYRAGILTAWGIDPD